MAVVPPFRGRIPEDSQIVSYTEALQLQTKLISKWTPQLEVWSLKYGHGVLGLMSAVCGVTVNSFFRRPLKLRDIGRKFTYLALGIGPGLFAAAMHSQNISDKIMLYDNTCPICVQTKSVMIQNACSIGQPLLVSPVINLALAASAGFRVPYLREVKEVAKYWFSAVRPAMPTLTVLFAVNTFLATLITYKEFESMDLVQGILLEMEKDYEHKKEEKFHSSS